VASGGLCVGYVLVHVPGSRAWGIGTGHKCHGKEQGREGEVIFGISLKKIKVWGSRPQPLRQSLANLLPEKGMKIFEFRLLMCLTFPFN
jgi:hypothetical protein